MTWTTNDKRRKALALGLVASTCLALSLVGYHAHGSPGTTLDGASRADRPADVSCAACALAHAPALESLSCVGPALGPPAASTEHTDSELPRCSASRGPGPSRAPPASA